ncbi:MAG: hypothetical protein CV087_01185 [Candidatus Brocadia sp. WS118]|nr:MAG: hypothetical protein CV087_01185 [Candidatus Brocadia sp. WS118]
MVFPKNSPRRIPRKSSYLFILYQILKDASVKLIINNFPKTCAPVKSKVACSHVATGFTTANLFVVARL